MDDLTPIQEKALALIAAGAPISAAADAAGIHRNTIYNWLRSAGAFRLALHHAREAKALFWREQAEEAAAAAIDTIRTLMTDPAVPASVRLKAALSILNLAIIPPIDPPPAHLPERVHNSAQPAGALPYPAEPEPAVPEVMHNSAQPLRRSAPKIGRNAPGSKQPGQHLSRDPDRIVV